MRKILTCALLALLFALLLALPTWAEDAAALDIPMLAPIACAADEAADIIDLYCGPTQGFYRHGGQELDLGRPYVTFGQYDCWAMVAQGTPDAFGPIGWVETALLASPPEAASLGFEDGLPAMVEEDAPITNDPLAFGSNADWTISLARGTEVIILAQLGNWLYVQTAIEDVPARVFLPAAAIL